jgi:hypothetical protein
MSTFGKFQIQKAVTRDLGNLNSVHDLTEALEDSPNIPSLLTSLINLDEYFLNTDKFEHDKISTFVTLPSDKAFFERGDYFDAREEVKTHLFKLPSWGIQSFIRNTDALRARQPGSKDTLDNVERLVQNDLRDMRRSMALLSEKALAHLITTGTSYVPNGSAPVTDFYAEYAGLTAATRPTVEFELLDPNAYPRENGEDVRALINDSLLDGQAVGGYVMLCGRNFFRQRISHIKEEQAMVDRTGIANQDPLIQRLGNFAQQYRMYRGSDDILYVMYDAKIGGTPLIPDNEAYCMPANTMDIFIRAYAPAEVKPYVNSIAVREYAWRSDNDFTGTHLMMESNFGDFLVNPLSIIKCTIKAAP